MFPPRFKGLGGAFVVFLFVCVGICNYLLLESNNSVAFVRKTCWRVDTC